jgi:hypothetical protein
MYEIKYLEYILFTINGSPFYINGASPLMGSNTDLKWCDRKCDRKLFNSVIKRTI